MPADRYTKMVGTGAAVGLCVRINASRSLHKNGGHGCGSGALRSNQCQQIVTQKWWARVRQWGFAFESMPADRYTKMVGTGAAVGLCVRINACTARHTNVSWVRVRQWAHTQMLAVGTGAAVGLGARQDVDGCQFNAPRGTLHGTLCRTSHREESDSPPILQTRGKSRMKHLQGAPKPET
jgi:hypothetical protein